MKDKTKAIKIYFPCDVSFPEGFEQTLHSLIDMVCKQYERENPERVMWPAGSGGEPLGSMMFDDTEFDMSVLCIDVAEREDLYGNNIHNPNRDELHEKLVAERKARKQNRNKG